LLVRHYVELGWENALRWGRSELRIFTHGYFGAVLSESQDQFVERITCVG
jgi:hypothetical protein